MIASDFVSTSSLTPSFRYKFKIDNSSTNSCDDWICGNNISNFTSAYVDVGEIVVDYTFTTSSTSSTWTDCYQSINWSEPFDWVTPKDKAKDRLRDIIRNRQSPAVIVRDYSKRYLSKSDERERRARETLKRVIGEKKYRYYLKNGFITIKARSGLMYQIFPAHGITSVYDQGKIVNRLCVILRGNFPPTDSLIMRYLMILNDEQNFRSLAIEHSVYSPINNIEEEDISLIQMFRNIKKDLRVA